jgi:pSer/pThr/pTyr-binding forkhead associated (FHA) protein
LDSQVIEIVFLIIRIAFVFLLFFFVYLVVQTINRELSTPIKRRRATANAGAEYAQPQPEPRYVQSNGTGGGRLVVLEIGTARSVRQGVVVELAPITTIGRRPDNTLPLDDARVSNEHALIAWRDGYWWVSDAGSTNGTQVNNQPINAPTPLNFGDIVGIGGVRMRLEP